MTAATDPWTLIRVLDWTAKRFGDAGIAGARLEAQVLLGHVLGLTRVQLYTQFDRPLGEDELAGCRALIKRRLAGEPVAYLIGEQEFWSRSFAVDPAVLIPRYDTETVIQVVLDAIPAAERAAPRRVLDLCTGSGAIAITLALELPGARVIGTDVSAEAIAVARANAGRTGAAAGDRLELRTGDLWAAVDGEPGFDVIAANPPYVRTGELAGLQVEVRREPRLALDGGADGLAAIRRIVDGLAAHLVPGGLAAIEHGFDQDAEVRALLDATGAFVPAVTRADLAGRPRVTWTRRPAGR